MEALLNLFQRSSWQRLLKNAIPCRCKICGNTSAELICPPCLASLQRPDSGQHCIQCGSEFPASIIYKQKMDSHCGSCLTTTPPFDSTLFPFYYTDPLASLIQQFKFNGDLILSHWFAQSIVEQLLLERRAKPLPDCLIPVPLHLDRLRHRGYNQSTILAKHIGTQLNIPVYKHAIIRQRDTPKQSGLNKQQRKRNLRGAFFLTKNTRALLQGRHIAIVDDVITTGSTLLAVSNVLNRVKPAHISLLAIAKTKHNSHLTQIFPLSNANRKQFYETTRTNKKSNIR